MNNRYKLLFKIVIGFVLLLLVVLVGILISFYLIAKSESKMSITEVLDKMYLSDSKEKNISYVIVTVVNDSVSYHSYGTNLATNTPTDSTTVFDIASLGKLFVSTVVKNLHEKKVIDLDASISPFFVDNVKNLSNFQDVTYRNLIGHTSGFPALPDNMLMKMQNSDILENPYDVIDRQDVFDYLETCANKEKVGQELYSNFGYGLIGISLELELKKSFDTIMQENLFLELGMNNTFVPKKGIVPQNLIQGYSDNKPAEFWFDNTLPASGSFVSNGVDISKFLRYQLGEYDDMFLSTDMIGWEFVGKFLKQEEYYWHNGMSGGYYSFLAIDKKNKIGVAILTNEADILTLKQFKTFDTIRMKTLQKKKK